MLNVSFPFQHFGNNLLQITGKHQRGNFTCAELGWSVGCEELLGDVCAWRWQKWQRCWAVLLGHPRTGISGHSGSGSAFQVFLSGWPHPLYPQRAFTQNSHFWLLIWAWQKPLRCKKYFPQLHFLAKFLLFYIYFLSVVILLGFEQKPHWFSGHQPAAQLPSAAALQACRWRRNKQEAGKAPENPRNQWCSDFHVGNVLPAFNLCCL